MKLLLVDSSYPINTRNIRLLESLKKLFNNSLVGVCAWNRDGRSEVEQGNIEYHIFERRAAYGSPIKKVIALFYYFFYLKKLNKHLKPDVLIASHWDMLFLCSIIKFRNQKLVYENLDLPTSANKLIRKILDRLEARSLKKVDLIIFASRFFEKRYDFFNGPTAIVENLPVDFSENINKKYSYTSERLKISFIGNVRYFDVMKNLIDSIEELDVEVLFWGEGPDLNRLKLYAQNNNRIKFFGKYEYSNIRDIYELSDLVWAVYPSLDYNVKYAISNKFYECFKYCRPGIFAKNTFLAELIEQDKVGFTVNPYDKGEIRSLISRILSNSNEIDMCKINISKFEGKKAWEDNESILRDCFENLSK